MWLTTFFIGDPDCGRSEKLLLLGFLNHLYYDILIISGVLSLYFISFCTEIHDWLNGQPVIFPFVFLPGKERFGVHSTGQRGFSLAEALIALAIVAMGILAVMGVLPASIQGVEETQNYNTAANLAQRLMEEILSNPNYDSIEATYNDSYYTRRAVPNFPAYTCNLKVEMLPNTHGCLKKVSVTVFWRNRRQENSFTVTNVRKKG